MFNSCDFCSKARVYFFCHNRCMCCLLEIIYWFKVYYKWVESKTHSVVPWGTFNVWAEIFYCWWKGFESCSSAMKCASNYLFIFPQLTLLDFPLFLLHLLWVWHNVFLFYLFIFLPQDFKWTVFLKKRIEN